MSAPAPTSVQTLQVAADEADLRLDRWFKRHFPVLGHGRLEKLLRTGQIRVDGKRVKANSRLEPGQQIRVPPLGADAAAGEGRPARAAAKPVSESDAAALRAAVLHRDDEMIAINKPAGLSVQGGKGIDRHVDGMLDALRFDAEERPRLVHRLDRDTSGVLLLARTARAASWLAAAFREKDTRKLYWAAVVGVPKLHQGKIDLALSKLPRPAGEKVVADEEGRRAITYYQVLEHAGTRIAWLALMPVTGRTHQLRAHCAAMGTPILGDGKYGGEAAFLPGAEIAPQLHLHARAIEVPRQRGGKIRIVAPLSPHMRSTWGYFGFDPERRDDPMAALEF
jgi:23S rRNA pseudouridine955/2504/2580 synthase